jgi:hypothetical protein
MGLAVARNVPPGTSLAGLTNLLRIIIRNRIYELEYLASDNWQAITLWLV